MKNFANIVAFNHRVTRGALLTSAALYAGLAALAPQASAQANGAANATPATDSGGGQLQEIVVTAQKRSESVQKVPITISVISEQAFKAAGITDTSTLVQAVPGLILNRQAGVAQPFLRGVGAFVSVPGAEAAVSTYVDGVYQAAGEANIFSLNNISRVEVLKGPQGTLFGRNSVGGVISIITKDPSQTPHIDLMAGYGNFNTVEASAYATSGITSNLASDISLHYQKQADGWGRNLTTGKPAFSDNYDFEARSKSIWTPDDHTKLTFIVDFLKDRSEEGANTRIHPGEVDVIGQPSPGFYNLSIDNPSHVLVRQGGVSLKIEHDLDFANFVSISAYRKTHSTTVADVDSTAAPLVTVANDVKGDQITQELQLLSKAGSPIKWIAGAFYFHNNTRAPAILYGEALASPAAYGAFDPFLPAGTVYVGTGQNEREITTSYSGFGEVTASFLEDKAHLTGGLRYTADKQALDSTLYLLTAPAASPNSGPFTYSPQPIDFDGPLPYCNAGEPCHQSTRNNSHKLTYRGVINYQITSDVMVFGSYTTGFQSGFYNTFVSSYPVLPLKPETARAIEAGIKSEFFDHKLRINVSAFQTKVSNLQVFATLAGVAVATNAGRSTIRGVDGDFALAPTRHLSIQGGFEYLDAKYDSYPGAQYFTYVNPADRLTPPHQGTPLDSFVADAAGNHLQQAPTFSATLSATYTLPTAAGDFTLNGSVAYNNGFFWDPQNRLSEPAHALVNSALGWTSPNSEFGVQVWVRNLLNEKVDLVGTPESFGDIMSPAPPRTFGVRVTAHL